MSHTVEVNESVVTVHEPQLRPAGKQRELSLQLAGEKLIIGIQERHKPAPAFVDAPVPGGAASSVQVAEADEVEPTAKLRGVPGGDRRRLIGRAVVNEYDLPVTKRLRDD